VRGRFEEKRDRTQSCIELKNFAKRPDVEGGMDYKVRTYSPSIDLLSICSSFVPRRGAPPLLI
jgi:hypothetical protein